MIDIRKCFEEGMVSVSFPGEDGRDVKGVVVVGEGAGGPTGGLAERTS